MPPEYVFPKPAKPRPDASTIAPYKSTTPLPDPARKVVDTSGIKPIVADGVDGRSGQFTKVEPADLTSIASALDKVVDPLTASFTPLADVHVKPGRFDQANSVRNTVGDRGTGLVGTYNTNMTGVRDALAVMVRALKSLAKSYRS